MLFASILSDLTLPQTHVCVALPQSIVICHAGECAGSAAARRRSDIAEQAAYRTGKRGGSLTANAQTRRSTAMTMPVGSAAG